MYYKLFSVDGEYKDKTTGEVRDMMEVDWDSISEEQIQRIYFLGGDSVDWYFFDTIEEAMFFFNVEKKPNLLSL